MLNLRVSVASSDVPLHLTLPETATPSDLRAAIFLAQQSTLAPDKHRLRLISAGKLLTSSAPLTSAGVTDGSFIHCAVSDLPPRPSTTPSASSKSRPASATATQSTTPTSATTQPVPILVTENATGETRILLPAATQTVATLRAAGLSDHQIIAVRFPFLLDEQRTQSDSHQSEHRGAASGPLHIDLEELEANEQLAFNPAEEPTGDEGAAVVFPDPEEGTWADCLWGFLLGALLGLIMLILSMDRSIALSRRWKKGIGLGAIANIVFGIVMLINDGSPR